MPGVLIDENPFGLENLNSGGGGGDSIYDFVGYSSSSSSSPSLSHNNHQSARQQQQQQHTTSMRRLSSFSAGMMMKDGGGGGGSEQQQSSLGLSPNHSVPNVYQRSHSFGNACSGSLHAFNYFGSPPDSPAKSDLGLSLLDGVDESCFGDGGSGKGLFLEGMEGGGGGSRGGGGSGCSDLRSLSFGGSAMSGSLVGSPTFADSVHSFNKFLPCNNEDEEAWPAVDMYGCDQFRMFEFKVRRCMRGRSHDWTECPFAHPGEKARRRDPRRFHYSGTACPDFRKGTCRRGDACEYAHGVFECWLHPARYRTQPCKDGRNCRRRVCFFAHTPEQLRLLPAAAQAATVAARSGGGGASGGGSQASALSATYDGCPVRGGAYDGAFVYERSPSYDGSPLHSTNVGSPLGHFNGLMMSSAAAAAALSGHCSVVPSQQQMSSPTSTLVGHAHSPPPLSPPLSPSGSPPPSPSSSASPHGWPSSPSCFSAACLSAGQAAAMSQALTQASVQAASSLSEGGAYKQAQATLARSQSINISSSSIQGMGGGGGIGVHPHSPPTPAHRRHLDRLNSMPMLSIPSGGEQRSGSAPVSPAGGGGGGGHQSKSMLELVATLQQLEFRGISTPPSSQWLQQHYSSGPSPLRRCSVSVPGTPTKVQQWEQHKDRWEYDDNNEEPAVQRVESGRDLRAKIYGRLGKENPMEAGNGGGDVVPDLGWVNELVKEEPEQTPAW